MKTVIEKNSSSKTLIQKEFYEFPNVEILQLQVEKGFAATPTGSGNGTTGSWGSGTW